MPVLRTYRWWCGMSDFKQRLESATPHHQRRPPQRGRWHRQKDKNRSPSAKNQTLKVTQKADQKKYDVTDVTRLINMILGTVEKDDAYDFDSDGILNVTDVTSLINIILQTAQ